MTDLDFVVDYCVNQYGAEAEYPWDDPNFVFRHKDNKKWYLLIMPISVSKLGLKDDRIENVMNLKCDPMVLDTITRDMDGVFPGYHMNHRHWISVILDGTVDRKQLTNLIDMSYTLTGSKPKKRKKD